ncbi:MAG: aldo/keto reductase [Calditrichaceae bacterium]|nr:aldo/keto reductase [Calditrichaceae bacterium]MBN2710246.1 aldo/keto reductase [Calditrichaceae bacterium]RQV93870.1 MAG: L-glyceraldehyde 3-phosphate reductase [Calditrichota bacterium]
MGYLPDKERYANMIYNRCGKSGLKLPAVSLGLWHNFGGVDSLEKARTMIHKAFDLGITHFDLANNYGPPPGSAEKTFGHILRQDFTFYRDQMIISTKAGYPMWHGPYGDFGSRKSLIASIDQSLERLNVEYVDIFYHHRPDPETPLEETVMALDYILHSGRALYIGISNYNAEQTIKAAKMFADLGTPFIIHQVKYNMFERSAEDELFAVLKKSGIGCITFSPLAQGLLTDKYLEGIPENSRAANPYGFLKEEEVEKSKIEKARKLNELAAKRGQTLAQMALSWTLRNPEVTSTLFGASCIEQIEEAVQTPEHSKFTASELKKIDEILNR